MAHARRLDLVDCGGVAYLEFYRFVGAGVGVLGLYLEEVFALSVQPGERIVIVGDPGDDCRLCMRGDRFFGRCRFLARIEREVRQREVRETLDFEVSRVD